MRIKEVEQRTGLTAKAIRLYESKGLLTVARQTDNDYRDYTQEDVERLKTIGFLREMGISISGIKDWVDGKLTMRDLMRFTAGKADDEEEAARLRAQLAREALALMETDPDLDLMTAVEEVQALQELKWEIHALQEQLRGDLLRPVFITIVSLGPIGWTLIHILEGRAEDAIWAFVLSIPMAIWTAFRWFQYFQVSKTRRSKAGCLPALLWGICAVFLVFGLFIFIEQCQIWLFSPDEDALMVFRQPWAFLVILLPIVELFFAFYPNYDQKEKTEEQEKIGLGGWMFVIALNLVLLYGCVTGVSFCTAKGFTRYSFFGPLGTTYALEDVVQVEAGFYGKSIAAFTGHESGDFYYKVTFADGKTENWSECTPVNGETDTWEILLMLDEWLMSGDVKKISSDKNREHFMYDVECLEICDTIIANK